MRHDTDAIQNLKFYQTGTFTVGNRLLAPEQRTVQASIERTNSLNSRPPRVPGLRRGARRALRDRRGDARDAATSSSPSTRPAASRCSRRRIRKRRGRCRGSTRCSATPPRWPPASRPRMRAQGHASNVRVIAQGGDGGTTDIGFGCLSGMFERNDDVLYICYDNEAYMNTGVQRSLGDAARPRARRRRWRSARSPATCSARARTCR